MQAQIRGKTGQNRTQDVLAENHIRCLLHNGCKSVSMALASIPKLEPKRDSQWDSEGGKIFPGAGEAKLEPGPKAKQL